MTTKQAEETRLWQAYHRAKHARQPNPAQVTRSRNALVLFYQGLVQHCVQWVQLRLVKRVPNAELMSAGNLGLIDAIQRFDPQRRIKFVTYATLRIRGAIMDDMRHMDTASRHHRDDAHRLARAQQAAAAHLQHTPNLEHIAQELRVTAEAVERLRTRAALATPHSKLKGSHTSRHDLSDQLNFEFDDLRQFVLQYVSDQVTKDILLLYYDSVQRSFREIAEMLNITATRARQKHKNAIEALRKQLKERRIC